MLDAKKIFESSLQEAKGLNDLYRFLAEHLKIPYPAEDLLRSEIVHAVSALDKLLHDLIRFGMIQIFLGTRPVTPKYLAETMTFDMHSKLVSATLPPKEVVFEAEIARKLGHLSFQDPDKIADGLSLIWDERNKWHLISAAMGMDAATARTQLKLISTRRNAIVHQSDMDPISNQKNSISPAESRRLADFIEKCGLSIFAAVR